MMPSPRHRPAFVFTLFFAAAGLIFHAAVAEEVPYAPDRISPPTSEWCTKIKELAPAKPTIDAPKRKILVFSASTGYYHEVIPHVDYLMQALGERSGAFDTTVTRDLESLAPEKLANYDVLVLNNNCSKGSRRNLLLDILESDPKYAGLTADQRSARAKQIEQSVLDFTAGGKGLVVIHGALVMMNNSKAFTEMVGGAFDYHPASQNVWLRTVDANHPLTAAFHGHEPFVHRDEPYLFKGPYDKLHFRPLLIMDATKVVDPKGGIDRIARYVAWIKPFGQGRVFYCSPGHYPATYESATILRFLLDGIQYAAGDLKCDDSTPKSH
jgi:type 1 glutamine amidotransferase